MSDLYLIAVIAGTEVAIRSDCIESVVTTGDVIEIPKCDPMVAGLMALRSRVLTLIDCQYAITGNSQRVGPKSHAIIVEISGHNYALSVDAVRDVVSVEPEAIRAVTRLDHRWSAISTAIAVIDDRVLMVVSPERLLSSRIALAA
jgi:purine-binding chemotaxis protein CheW